MASPYLKNQSTVEDDPLLAFLTSKDAPDAETLTQLGNEALQSGKVSPEQAQALARDIAGKVSTPGSPYNKLAKKALGGAAPKTPKNQQQILNAFPSMEPADKVPGMQTPVDPVNAKLAESAQANAANNQAQVMAQFSPPTAVAEGSGLEVKKKQDIKNVTGTKNVMDTKDVAQTTTGTKNTTGTTDQISQLQQQVQNLAKEQQEKATLNQMFSPEQINAQASTWRDMPEFQNVQRGQEQLQNMIAMEAQRPIVQNMAHPLALLADAISFKPRNLAASTPSGQDTAAARGARILEYQQKLQKDKEDQANALRSAILGSKGGSQTMTLQTLKEATESTNKLEQLQKKINELVGTTQQQDTHTDGTSLTDTTENTVDNSIEATATDPKAKANSAANVKERMDRADYRTLFNSIDKDPVLKTQLLAGNSLVTQFHQLALPNITPQQVSEGMQTVRNTTTGLSGGSRSGVSERAETYMSSIDREFANLVQKWGNNVQNIPQNDPQFIQVKQELAAAYDSLSHERRSLIYAKLPAFQHVLNDHPDWEEDINNYAGGMSSLTGKGKAPSVKGVVTKARADAKTGGYDGSKPLPANATPAQKSLRLDYLKKKGS